MAIELKRVGGKLRTVYQQLDGNIELADLCTCRDAPDLGCPIDEHAVKARAVEMLREERERVSADLSMQQH